MQRTELVRRTDMSGERGRLEYLNVPLVTTSFSASASVMNRFNCRKKHAFL